MALIHKPHLTQQAHDLIRSHFENLQWVPNIAIDATCGNGYDTLFLVSLAKHVSAFDIQKMALEQTRQRLMETKHDSKVKLLHTGHENISQHVSEKVDCIMFNLGYLPKADKAITTKTETTLTALDASLKLLSVQHGLLSILCYPGHSEGKHETRAIKHWLKQLPSMWNIQEYLSSVPNEKSPILFQVKYK